MTVKEGQVMDSTEHTPAPWRVIDIPTTDKFFVAAEPYEGHPYYKRTRTIEVMSDEDYPTKRADAEHIVRCVNSWDDPALLRARLAEIDKCKGETR